MANEFTDDPNVILLMKMDNNLNDDASAQTVDNDGVTFSSAAKKEGTHSAVFAADTATIQYANLDSAMPLTSTGSGVMTICLWLRHTNDQIASSGLIAGRWDNTDNKYTWMLYTTQTDEYLKWAVYNGGSDSHDTGYKTYQSRWLHIALRWNNSTKAYDFRVWDDTDGAVECEDSGTLSISADVSNEGDFTIGQQTDESSTGLMGGYVDELVIFDRWLTDDEIDAVRNGTYRPPVAGGLGLALGANF